MTTKTIDRKKRITDFIKAINNITSDETLDKKGLYGKRHKKIKEECDNEQRYLGEGRTQEQSDNIGKSHKIASSTYVSYLTDYRNAILDLNQKGLNTEKDIKRIQKKYKDIDLSLLNASMPKLRENLETLKKKYRDIDQGLYTQLHKLRIEHHAYYSMKPKIDVIKRVKSKNADSLITKHTAQKVVSEARINQILNELDGSQHWVDLTIFIAMASGRRAIEILKTGSFEKSKKNHVFFKGQAKTKTRDDAGSFIIPSLVSPKKLMDTHERLRSILDKEVFYDKNFNDLTNDEINGATAGRLNNKVKSIFDGDEFVFKDLRALYAKQASAKYHDPKKESLAVFYSSILGHSEKDIATQLSYQGLVVSDEEIEPAKIEHTTDEKNYGESDQKTLKHIESFDKEIEERKGLAEMRIHEFVKKTLKKDPDAVITKTFLGKPKAMGGLGASRPAIKKYLNLVGIYNDIRKILKNYINNTTCEIRV